MNSASPYSSPELDPLKTRCLPESLCLDFPQSWVEWDSRVRETWHNYTEQHPQVTQTLHWLVEDHLGIASLGLLVLIVFWRCFRRPSLRAPLRSAARAGLFIAGLGLCDLASSGLKVFFGRLKPHVGFYNPNFLPALSFPSNHAANTSFLCMFLFLASATLPERFVGARKVYGGILLLLLIFIDFSRIVLGEHYPMDAVAGTFFGLLAGAGYWSLVKLVTSTKP